MVQKQPNPDAADLEISHFVSVTSCLGLASAGSSKNHFISCVSSTRPKRMYSMKKMSATLNCTDPLEKNISGGLLNKRNN